jgi:hypothetical protein
MARSRRSKDWGRASITSTAGYTISFSHYPPTDGARQREELVIRRNTIHNLDDTQPCLPRLCGPRNKPQS